MVDDRPAQFSETDDQVGRGEAIGVGHRDTRDYLANVRRQDRHVLRAKSMRWHC
jgi:hypothetical protein